MCRSPEFADNEHLPQHHAIFPENAKPKLQNVGGGQRVLAVLPEPQPTEVWESILTPAFGECVSTCSTETVDICVVCETEGIAISATVDALTHMRPHILELAGRLHARQDVPW